MEKKAKKESGLIEKSLKENLIKFLGEGTESNPFLISDVEGFNGIRNNLSAFYRLSSDIDFAGGMVTPIGTQSMPFAGGLDGDGHIVKNFKINGKDSCTGLFGYANGANLINMSLENGEITQTPVQYYTGGLAGYLKNCIIKNIRLNTIAVSGTWYVGALSGRAEGGRIIGCCAVGNITAKGSGTVGGLIGCVDGNAYVGDSYAVGSVSSTGYNDNTGGLVGSISFAAIRNCYAACRVVSGSKVSGLGDVYNATVENSYYNSLTAGFGTTDDYNVGKLTTSLVRKRFYEAWDFENVWDIEEGNSYPYLRKAGEKAVVRVDVGKKVSDGIGTESDPYLLNNAAGFSYIGYDLAGFYRLTTDIDFGGATVTPIGTLKVSFSGGIDGAGYTIKNFIINRGDSYTGLFGYAIGAKFIDLSLENGGITQTSVESYAGGLAGYLKNCIIENIRLNTITVSGRWYVGALAGQVEGGSILGCCVDCNTRVIGVTDVGSLIGGASNSVKINECCAEGEVTGTGTSNIGGLIGYANADIKNSYFIGNVISTANSYSAGGLTGYASSANIKNCYAACRINTNGSGLTSVYSSQVEHSYFDSNLARKITPETQARTTGQMISKDTYIGWDWDDIWSYETASYPVLRNIEAIKQESFELSFRKLTSHSVIIKWPDIPRAGGYDILYQDKIVSLAASEILIENLAFDTDYEFRVKAEISDTTRVWSKTLRLRTKKLLYIEGLHSIGKTKNSLSLTWKQQDNAESYEIIYNGNVQKSSTNSCTITELNADVPYLIRVNALITDGSIITSSPIVEKLYDLSPQTDYAREFIGKCEDQTWFIDEIEKLLNRQGKSINTINSKGELAAIYAIGFTNRGINGRIPPAIGELYGLKYLYLANNELSGAVPDELGLLEHLIEVDLTGNYFLNETD